MKYFLTIAASDNSGGAGIQQDIKVAYMLGYWSLSAITGITVQDFQRAYLIRPVEPDLLRQQIDKSLEAFPVAAVKIGALTSEENIRIVAQALQKHKPSVVVLDTVIATSSGKAFLSDYAVEVMKKELFPLTTVITPNKLEFELITGQRFSQISTAVEVAKEFTEKWKTAIVLKGGHFNDNVLHEAVITPSQVREHCYQRLDFSAYSHGTGCTFSSALACFLADGQDLFTAYEHATDFVRDFYQKMQAQV